MTENLPPVYAGLDIAKASLQLHFQSCQHSPANSATGHAQLIKLLRAEPRAHVICEATGGYERPVVAALQAARIPVSVVNPGQVRHFALSLGRRAKSDSAGRRRAHPVWRLGPTRSHTRAGRGPGRTALPGEMARPAQRTTRARQPICRARHLALRVAPTDQNWSRT